MSAVSATAGVPYLDLSDPEFSVRSDAVREARELSWWAQTNYGIAVLRYEQVRRLLRDRRLRQGSRNWPAANGVGGPFAQWWSSMLLNLEGEDHTRLRRLLAAAFAPTLIARLAPRFRALADELIDGFVEAHRCEFVSQFAEPYAARVIAIVLGIPEGEWQAIARWSSDLGLALAVTIKDDLPRIEAALEGLYGYADELIERGETSTGDDFLTRLVHEGGLSLDELRVSIVLLIFGGMDTTRNQLGLALEAFSAHPDQWEIMARRSELAAAAVEEVMRLRPTVTWVTREAIQDFVFEGVEIGAGTVIHLFCLAGATDGFDITAERMPHFGFGGGTHHCIGRVLARTDMAEALAVLARRLARPRLDGEISSLPLSGNTGPTELPIAFTPRATRSCR